MQELQKYIWRKQTDSECIIKPGPKKEKIKPLPLQKSTEADFLIEHKCNLNSSVWSEYETCLLFTTVNAIVSSLVPLSVNNITSLYNHVVQSNICLENQLPLRCKQTTQIQGKLKQLEEKQRVMIAKAGGQ